MVDGGASLAEVSSFLEGVLGGRKVDEVRALGGVAIGKLYELARNTAPVTFADLVPADTPAGATVVYEGRNSLVAFCYFQKCFTRTADGLVFGHNRGISSFATGPGYFQVELASEAHKGELLFDYAMPPPFEPAGWPRYVRNDRGLSRFVFAKMYDFVRKVATGVFVGTAFKLGVAQDVYFSLTLPS
jgi:hypothetical protein